MEWENGEPMGDIDVERKEGRGGTCKCHLTSWVATLCWISYQHGRCCYSDVHCVAMAEQRRLPEKLYGIV